MQENITPRSLYLKIRLSHKLKEGGNGVVFSCINVRRFALTMAPAAVDGRNDRKKYFATSYLGCAFCYFDAESHLTYRTNLTAKSLFRCQVIN